MTSGPQTQKLHGVQPDSTDRREMTLRDKAFEFAKGAGDARRHAEAKDRLQREFPEADSDAIVEAYLDASRLCDAAYDFGDRLIRGMISEAEALKRAKHEHPGFSDTTYAQFLSYGVLVSR